METKLKQYYDLFTVGFINGSVLLIAQLSPLDIVKAVGQIILICVSIIYTTIKIYKALKKGKDDV